MVPGGEPVPTPNIDRPGLHPRWLVLAAAVLWGTTGTVLLVGAGDRSDVDPIGIALAVGAGASYAVYLLVTKLLLDAIGGLILIATGLVLLVSIRNPPVRRQYDAGERSRPS